MTKLTLKYHRLSPNEAVSSIKDKSTGKKNWRHRFATKDRVLVKQHFKDYPPKQFGSLAEFEKFVENLPKPKGFVI